MKIAHTLMSFLKVSVFTIFTLLMTVNIAEAYVVVGTSSYSHVVYVPGHWYHGYWVPGRYVQYANPAPVSVWVGGGGYYYGPSGYYYRHGGYYRGYHGWHNGYYHHGYYHGGGHHGGGHR